jgi:hypothetical protein
MTGCPCGWEGNLAVLRWWSPVDHEDHESEPLCLVCRADRRIELRAQGMLNIHTPSL